MRPVVIAGGGIGGLTAAIALRRAGFESIVLEQAPKLEPVGAGLAIQPNALAVLDRLGVGEAVRAAGFAPDTWRVETDSGTVLTNTPNDGSAGGRIFAIHRADLHRVLLDAMKPDTVRLSSRIEGFESDGARVVMRLGSGDRIDAPVLIGADGLHSVVRAQLFGAGAPKYAGYTSWRGITRPLGDRVPRHGAEIWGSGRRFGLTQVGGTRAYWFAVLNAPPGERDASPELALASLQDLFRGFPAPALDLIAATDPSAILRTDIADRDPIHVWGRGRVTLLGDAAHPMTPNLGQGACQAIEDAMALAACVQASRDDLQIGLRNYEGARAARANGIVSQARTFGVLGQLENGALRFMRNLAVRAVPASAQRRQMAALWTYPGPWID